MNSGATKPMLSVIVPMFQSGATVAETLRSILAERVEGGLEVAVVDDGSTDDGPRVVEGLRQADDRVRMVSQANLGLAGARNTGIAHARGEWLRFVDADDRVTVGSCQRLIDHALRRGLAAACGSHELINECGEPLGRICPARGGADGTVGIEHFLEGNRCGVGTVVIRADALGAERFDPALRVCEDWDLWLRLSARPRGVRMGVCPGEPVKEYRVRRASLSKDFAAMLATGQDVLRRAYRRVRADAIAGLDASIEREAKAMHRLALEWSTMRALGDREGRVEEAAAMFESGRGRAFDVREAAEAAYWGSLLGLGIRPEVLDENGVEWLRRVRAWWAVCADRGWMASNTIDVAWGLLASLAVSPRDVARECVREAAGRGGRGVIIFGAGENGRLLLRAAKEVDLALAVRDDRLDRGELDQSALPSHTMIQPMSSPIEAGWSVIVSPLDDARIVARRSAPSDIRWSVVRQRLALDLEFRMRQAMREAGGICSPAPALGR